MFGDELGSDFFVGLNKRLARIFALSDKNGATNKDETNPNKKILSMAFHLLHFRETPKTKFDNRIAVLKHEKHVCYD